MKNLLKILKFKKKLFPNIFSRGAILIQILVFSSLAAIMITALSNWSANDLKLGKKELRRETAFQVAEAGIEYYRWHLAASSTDFMDGTYAPGPYIHNYYDKDGNLLGTFSLEITPEGTGSTKVKIISTGTVVDDSNITRKIEVMLAKPSFAEYAIATDSDVYIGEGTEVFGPVHANGGVRFDGYAHNIVSSSLSSYKDPSHNLPTDEYAVHTHLDESGTVLLDGADPVPPEALPVRSDVFEVGRAFPVPEMDFDRFTKDLYNLKELAKENGIFLSDSGMLGYHLVLKTDDTFDIYKVSTETSLPSGCSQYGGIFGWGPWSIDTETFIENQPFPANGIIFVDDHAWVDGQINGAKLTIATGRLPENQGQEKHIMVNKDLLYTSYDGTDKLGLVAQGNIIIGMTSEDDLRIDGAMVGKTDRILRYYYKEECAPYDIRNNIYLYGSLTSSDTYGFSYDDGNGYQNITIVFDPELLYEPPPSFPLVSDEFQTVYWKEIK